MIRTIGNIVIPVLVIVALVAGIAVVIGQRGIPKTLIPTATPLVSEDIKTQQLSQQGASDDPAAIEQDLNDTDLSGIDKELTDIERELSSY
ncbi:hypothetical protein HYV21_01480 [Candidatus Microgenomates bacterium]|nr:hypothetical protein [Candidatus Microgenomates bacterium]